MREEGVAAGDVRVAYAADMRYVGQAYELEVPIAVPVVAERLPEILAGFHAVHERVYGYARTQQPVEFVNFRAVHTYPLPKPNVRPSQPVGGHPLGGLGGHVGALPTSNGQRRAYFGSYMATAIYDRARLPLGSRLPGPAIVEQVDTTTVIPPGVTALVDDAGNLRLRKG
jgi:N-methylhydantoinase A